MLESAEHDRLHDHRAQRANWKRWGPYVSDRAWGTVREDYSPDGAAWDHFPHDHARSRAYRWNEDGLAGWSDREQHLCLALALWNGRDAILKERLFGLTGPQGNHAEDVKEIYFFLDGTPTHSYMKMLYKYPQAAFPYDELVAENGRRGLSDPEFELLDTGAFDEDRYFDVFVEYAKAGPEDILMRVTAVNRGPEPAELHILPTVWFRNTWSWGYKAGPMADVPGRPSLRQTKPDRVRIDHPALGEMWWHAEAEDLLFTENETNFERLYAATNHTPYVKDAVHRTIVDGESGVVNPDGRGTKVAAHHRLVLAPGESRSVRVRLGQAWVERPFEDFDALVEQRRGEADAFYAAIQRSGLDDDARDVQRQALAGMLWTKQLYYYDVEQWLRGDPGTLRPPDSRREGRNSDWQHLNNFDVISMPDGWEYPWYAAWDLAFHCLPLAIVDPDYARRQLELMTREWYMHPNGQLPAYEWALGDVNPPVHAWAAWQIYRMEVGAGHEVTGRTFLEGVFHKLLLNFTWWVNRKDIDGNNVFQGGFLGLDNISLFDRSAELPTGGHIDQADGTAWMGFYTLSMLRIALELSRENPVYQQLATKFFEHFLAIANAIGAGFDGQGLWDEEDGFYYDVLHLPDGSHQPLRVRSLVGLMPLLAVTTLHHDMFEGLPIFRRRMRWFLDHRPHLAGNLLCTEEPGADESHILSILTPDRLRSVLAYMLDEEEFLSPYGVRSLSKVHSEPYVLDLGSETFSIRYEPAESRSEVFGGNSNWRGPVWFPINYLLIEALHEYHRYFGDDFRVECPTGSGVRMSLDQVADELSRRLVSIFLRDESGDRPVFGGSRVWQDDPHWRDYPLFYEYFHGDDGAGLGASHQTGWTGLVANLIQQVGGARGDDGLGEDRDSVE